MSLNVNHATGNPIDVTVSIDYPSLNLSAGDTYSILAPQIMKVTVLGTGSIIYFTSGSGEKVNLQVDESAATIISAAEQVANLSWTNPVSGSTETIGINAHNITSIASLTGGTSSMVMCDFYGTGPTAIELTTSFANLKAALTATASDATFPSGINTNTINPYSGTKITLTGELIRTFSSLATAGNTQGTASLIVSDKTMLTGVTVADSGAILPSISTGASFTVYNSDASDDAKVYPPLSEGIDQLGANTAFVLPPLSMAIFEKISTTVGAEWVATPVKSDSQLFAPSGAVGSPGLSFKNTRDMGFRDVSATQLGFVVGGAYTALVDASGLVTNVISEQTVGLGTVGKFKPYVLGVPTVGANAITIPSGATTFSVNAAGVSNMTIADPSPVQEGVRLTFIATTANAHTLSNAAGSGFNNGGGGSDLATFGGALGDNIVIEAIGGKWYVVSSVNIVLS